MAHVHTKHSCTAMDVIKDTHMYIAYLLMLVMTYVLKTQLQMEVMTDSTHHLCICVHRMYLSVQFYYFVID